MAEDLKTLKFRHFNGTKLPVVWRYGIPVLAVAVSLLLTYLFQSYVFRTPLFFLSIMISTWVGGIGPGMFAAVLSTLSMYIVLNPQGVVPTKYPNAPNVIAFLITSLLVSMWSASRRRVVQELQLARDELEAKVQERTVDLSRNNKQLQKEIAERKQAEDEGRRQKEILQKIFDNVPITISFYDEDGHLVLVNREYERTFGWTVRELDEQNLDVFVEAVPDPQERQRLLDFLGAATGEWLDFKIRAKDGRMIDVWGAVVRASDGTSIGIGQDITERESLKEQLHQAQKMEAVGQLAGGIAHDFNNLLTAINGYCELSLRKLQEGDPLYHNIKEVRQAGERAAMLTHQLLAFSRKQVLQPKILDLNSVVSEIEKMLRRIIGEHIELQKILETKLGSVEADPGQIEQVIVNLVVNARDAMPDGGKLIIETKNVYLDEIYAAGHIAVKPDFYVMLAISDTGIGMDEQTQSRIFEPFFTTKALGKGTGLGLSTVYGIVKQSGGDIRVYSERGRGTTFKIYFPRVGEKAQVYKKSIEPEQPVQGSETILLAEDDETVRELTREILETYGYKVLEAANGRTALLICERHQGEIHLLLTDVIMPEMSGRELANRLTRLHPEIKVLYMSGYTDNVIVHHGVVDSDIAFLEKPFTPEDLAHKIRRVLETD